MEKIFNQKNRKTTITLLSISIILLAAAFIVGISDNPPGIVLSYLGISGFILMFVHPWRQTKRFLYLLLIAIIAFPVFAILHNLMYALTDLAAGTVILVNLITFLDVASFLIAVLICPPAILIGAVGSLICYFKNEKSRESLGTP